MSVARVCSFTCWCTCLVLFGIANEACAESPKKREFELTYAATLKITADDTVRVWIPVPPTNAQQKVEIKSLDLPGKHSIGKEPKYGNQILYFDFLPTDQDSVRFSAKYTVTRHEFRALDESKAVALNANERELFLAANKMVPLGDLDIPLHPFVSKKATQLKLARSIYDHVDSLVAYDKSKPGYGRGDVKWVCDSRTGNCTDFHSLFISLARSAGLPARFEIGFPLPKERGAGAIGGYHCWAACFCNDHAWVPVDISEADKHPEMKDYYFGNLTENRIGFSVGRDLDLVPQQSSEPLNYFVYPHVEQGGQVLDKDSIQLEFSYKDLE